MIFYSYNEPVYLPDTIEHGVEGIRLNDRAFNRYDRAIKRIERISLYWISKRARDLLARYKYSRHVCDYAAAAWQRGVLEFMRK